MNRMAANPWQDDEIDWRVRKSVKRLIWLYFWLLIFEGVLRKWVLPSLANPLLIVRDPVVIVIYILTTYRGGFPRNGFVASTLALGFLTFAISLFTGQGNLLVKLYGWRANFLHLPLIFLIPNFFTAEDVKEMGKWLLITAGPMALLVLTQFISDPLAWINVGAGRGETGQLETALGKIRPPGTFSFTNGLMSYLSLLAAFLLYSPMVKKLYPRVLLFIAAPALMLMVGTSGSRAAVSSVTVIFAMLLFICLRRPAYFGRAFQFVFVGMLGYLIVSSWAVFQEGVMVHEARFEAEGGVKTGIIDRFFGDFLAGFESVPDAPLFGNGLGLGTNAAAGILTGERTFLLAEGEWSRVILESGPILGLAYILLRVAIVCYIGHIALKALDRDRPLALLIFSATFLEILNGQFGQPTALGFAVLGGGLCLSVVSEEELNKVEQNQTHHEPVKVRGRSAYAERLHGFTDNEVPKGG